MKIRIEDIPQEGLELSYEQSPEALDLSHLKRVAVRMSVQRNGANVFIRGEIDAAGLFECARCLKPFDAPLRSDIEVDFFPLAELGEEERELSAKEMDTAFYEEGVVSLDEVVRGQILLSTPIRLLCRADCRGLCSTCGEELNLGPCGCPAESLNPRFSTLKDFFSGQSEA